MSQTRVTLGPLQNPIRGLLHGSAGLVSLALVASLVRPAAAEAWALPGRELLLLFAATQAALFTASALYHSVPWSAAWKRRMQRVDHAMIYVGIAGAVTPILWLGLDGPERTWLLLAAWGIAALGACQKLFVPGVPERASIPVQIAQACLVLPAIVPFALRFPGAPVVLAAAGALLYGLGAVAFLSERPRLWPRIFSFHELFHLLVVAGSATHYALALHVLGRIP